MVRLGAREFLLRCMVTWYGSCTGAVREHLVACGVESVGWGRG